MALAATRHILLLFDIDGTLVHTGGAGRRAMSRAFSETCQVGDVFRDIPLSGRTDTIILSDVLSRCAIPESVELAGRFRATYHRFLEEELARANGCARVLPGVQPLLARLRSDPANTVALLTGNYSNTARLKLEHFGLWENFVCGAFGEDATTREGLVPVAVTRARALGMPPVEPANVVVVGDTPLDVACGRFNASRTIGVATGETPAGELHVAGADLVLESFLDVERFVEFLRALRMDSGRHLSSPSHRPVYGVGDEEQTKHPLDEGFEP
jgi:phosphoglycolate phosphatase